MLASMGGSRGVVAFISFSVSSLWAVAFWVSMLVVGISSSRSSKTLRAGVGGSGWSFGSGVSEPAREGARVELARERDWRISCMPSIMEVVLFARLFRHLCDKEGNRVPSRDVKPLEDKSLGRCLLTTGFIASSRSLAPSAKSYSGLDEVM